NFARPTSESKHQHSSKAKPQKRNTNEEQSTKLASLRDL
uniref:Uncharacterized protein n=1 Tax=Ciona savignyi TaxID=51511 RepID=H2YX60_CIOSA